MGRLRDLRRARHAEANGAITTNKIKRLKRIERLVARDGNLCAGCGEPLGQDITIDHIIPQALGGPNWMENQQLMHAKCNQKKANHLVWGGPRNGRTVLNLLKDVLPSSLGSARHDTVTTLNGAKFAFIFGQLATYFETQDDPETATAMRQCAADFEECRKALARQERVELRWNIAQAEIAARARNGDDQ